MKIKIYQLNKDERNLAFMNYAFTLSHGGVNPKEYKCVYNGYSESNTLEGLFEEFNRDTRPGNYRGHSLSTSDIVVVEGEAEPNWIEFFTSPKGEAYLYARLAVSNAFVKVICNDMSAFPGFVTDVLGDTLSEECIRIRKFLGDEQTVLSEPVQVFIAPLINIFANYVPKDMLQNHGWRQEDLRTAINNNIGIDESAYTEENKKEAQEICDTIQALASKPTDDFKENMKYLSVVKRGAYFIDSFEFPKIEFDSSKAEPLQGLRCLEIRPSKPPFETRIPDELDELQNAVSRYKERSNIEITYPFDDNAVVMGNEEAKLIGMEGNRRMGGDIYAGPIYILADDGQGGFCDLTDEQITKYSERFAEPEEIDQIEVEADTGYAIFFGM